MHENEGNLEVNIRTCRVSLNHWNLTFKQKQLTVKNMIFHTFISWHLLREWVYSQSDHRALSWLDVRVLHRYIFSYKELTPYTLSTEQSHLRENIIFFSLCSCSYHLLGVVLESPSERKKKTLWRWSYCSDASYVASSLYMSQIFCAAPCSLDDRVRTFKIVFPTTWILGVRVLVSKVISSTSYNVESIFL